MSFLGKEYKFVGQENFDNFLKAVGKFKKYTAESRFLKTHIKPQTCIVPILCYCVFINYVYSLYSCV